MNTLEEIEDIEDDKKVKKNWLTAFKICFAINILQIIIFNLYPRLQIDLGKEIAMRASKPYPANIAFHLFVQLIWITFISWFLYHCAYKKRGTLFILLSSIAVTLGIGYEFVRLVTHVLYQPFNATFLIYHLLFTGALNAYYSIRGWQLYLANRRYKADIERLFKKARLEESKKREKLQAEEAQLSPPLFK